MCAVLIRPLLNPEFSRLDARYKSLLMMLPLSLLLPLYGCGTGYVLNAKTGLLIASPDTVAFGSVSVGHTASNTVELSNGTSAPVTIARVDLTGQSFSVAGANNLPVTLAAGEAYKLSVQFNPTAAGTETGQVNITSNLSDTGQATISLSGTGMTDTPPAALSSLSCSDGAVTGSGTNTCSVSLTSAAASGGLSVSLSSSSAAVTVPSTVTVPANATSVTFTATVSPVGAAQPVTLKASAGGVSQSLTLQLNPTVPTLNLSAPSMAFGSVITNTGVTQSVTLTSTGTAQVTISSAALSGAGFSLSAVSFPATLNPGQALTLNVQFNPVTVGAVTGQLTLTSDSSTGTTTAINLSGTGTAAASLSGLSCSSGSITGPGSVACTVTLTSAVSGSGGLIVNLSSSNSAVSLPATVTVPTNATNVEFTATVSSVATAQVVTMTASVGGVLKDFTLQLNAAILALSINATSVAFGDVPVNATATQSVTLTSTGTVPVTINGATLTGAGFTMSGTKFPAALNPNQEATLNLDFAPSAVGLAAGELIIRSNSATNSQASIGLSGTGKAVIVVALTPASFSAVAGTIQQLAATVTGTSNTAVSWTVSGSGCSGSECGTISSSGIYTAPMSIPSPASVAITAASVADPSRFALADALIVPRPSTTYYLAPVADGGNDLNNGLSPQAPWLSPDHSLNCGDVITAKASAAYDKSNFYFTKWGKVTCPAGNNVAWLKCETFDGCKISSNNQQAIWINQSYWGVQGWELSATGNLGVCLAVAPTGLSTIHHIIVANNICNGGAHGFDASSENSTTSVDYIAFVGNISWNAAQSTALCNSGITVYEPINSDTLPGTHIFIAGNFSFDNASPTNCNVGKSTYDGNGIVLDDIGNIQSGGAPYSQQIVVENNIGVWNGGYGFGNTGNGTPSAAIFFLHNTSAHNLTATNSNTTTCGDVTTLTSSHTTISNNLIETGASLGCQDEAHPLYAVAVNASDSTDTVAANWIYSAARNYTTAIGSAGFEFGVNIIGTDPRLVNPIDPGQPNCAGKASAVDCMSAVISNYTPANSEAKAFGYQMPQNSSVIDPLFPRWLCNVDLPSGLVEMGCSN